MEGETGNALYFPRMPFLFPFLLLKALLK